MFWGSAQIEFGFSRDTRAHAFKLLGDIGFNLVRFLKSLYLSIVGL